MAYLPNHIDFEFEDDSFSRFVACAARLYVAQQKADDPEYNEMVPMDAYYILENHRYGDYNRKFNQFLFTTVFAETFPKEMNEFLDKDYLRYREWKYNHSSEYSPYWDVGELRDAVKQDVEGWKDDVSKGYTVNLQFSQILNTLEHKNGSSQKIIDQLFVDLCNPNSKASQVVMQKYNKEIDQCLKDFARRIELLEEREQHQKIDDVQKGIKVLEFAKENLPQVLQEYFKAQLRVNTLTFEDVKDRELGYDIDTKIKQSQSFANTAKKITP